MTNRMSVHIGLNAVDSHGYDGWNGPLVACESDADDMRALADGFRCDSQVLLTAEATYAAVLDAIARAAARLGEGDRFLLSYSGHGGQVPAIGGDEADQLDETWCLYDTQLRDNDLNHALAAFVPGVQILVMSDSCHSGTVTRSLAMSRDQHRVNDSSLMLGKRAPLERTTAEFDRHRDAYVAREVPFGHQVRATGALISGCRDDQESMDGEGNGAFTAAFLATWDSGAFTGNINDLHADIRSWLSAHSYVQEPQLSPVGPSNESYYALLNAAPVPW